MPRISGSFSKRKAVEFAKGQGFTLLIDHEEGERYTYKHPDDEVETMRIYRVGGFWNIHHHTRDEAHA